MGQELAPSLVRTGSPFIIGLVGSWLTRQGFDIDDDALAAMLVGIYGYGSYVVVRMLETYASPKWGYILGVKKTPSYFEDGVTPKHARPETVL